MKEIKVKVYETEYKDWVRIGYLLFRKLNPQNWIGFISSILICITSIIVLILILISGGTSFQYFILIIIAVFTLSYNLDFDRNIRKISKINYEQNIKDFKLTNFILNETGFHEEDAHSNNYSKWTDFKSALISKNYILLFLYENENFHIFISSNYSDEDFEQVKEWVRGVVKVL